MADDKTKTGVGDRRRVTASEDYEVGHFAKQNGITPTQTRDLIRKYGGKRAVLTREAAKLKV